MANDVSTRYLRLLPLHHSQKEVKTLNGNVYFEYFIAPTFDFIQELRTHGTDIRIMEPESLVEVFRNEAKKAYQLYC
jgi:predicted DNA-binding transcriptional regulator YafY